jgi:hypothetical protein
MFEKRQNFPTFFSCCTVGRGARRIGTWKPIHKKFTICGDIDAIYYTDVFQIADFQ